MRNLAIGIDPGKENGVAIFDRDKGRLRTVCSMKTFQVLMLLEEMSERAEVFIEDPTTWKPFGGKSQSHKLKGAGSVTARFLAIVEMLDAYQIPYNRIPIQGTLKKVDKDMFKKITGWDERTNEHGRDAAILCYNR